jgi:hypothetical protein
MSSYHKMERSCRSSRTRCQGAGSASWRECCGRVGAAPPQALLGSSHVRWLSRSCASLLDSILDVGTIDRQI